MGARISALHRLWTGLAGPMAFFVLLLATGSALACKPKDPQGKGKLDVCQQSFSMPYPTDLGQKISSYAIENIPKHAVDVHYALTFRPKPSNATLSQSFSPSATGENPDGTTPNPGQDEQAARVLFDWSALGPSTPAMGTVTYTVTFEEKARPLEVTIERAPKQIRVDERVTFTVHVYNPNDDPVAGHFVQLEFGNGSVFYVDYVAGDEPRVGDCQQVGDVNEARCEHLRLGKSEGGSMEVSGKFAAKGASTMYFSALGKQVADDQNVDRYSREFLDVQ